MLVIALLAGADAAKALDCQQDFQKIASERQQLFQQAQAAAKRKNREEICGILTKIVDNGNRMVKWLEENASWCSVPDSVLPEAKKGHASIVSQRRQVCSAPKRPALDLRT